MAINLDKVGTIVTRTFKRSDVANDKGSHKDNVAWWMNRYEALIMTEAEDVVRNAAQSYNAAIAMKNSAADLLAQFDQEVDETEREIARLGAHAFVEQLQPAIKERKAYLDNLYESLVRGRTEERWDNP
ncbi:MAG TPA: hypothetical protein VEG65_07025 [Candidatus Bathyarchaeia archaeon]|nr:hypothetical protein [Candidatus Bathyarchaeia archaeon]